jgi:hypothetical protein
LNIINIKKGHLAMKKVEITPEIRLAFEQLREDMFDGDIKKMSKAIGMNRGTYYQVLDGTKKGFTNRIWVKIEPYLSPYLAVIKLDVLPRDRRRFLSFFVPLKDNVRGDYG